MQNSIENETCFRGFEIRANFSKTNVFQGPILYPSVTGNIPLRISPRNCLQPFWETWKTTSGGRWYFHMWVKQVCVTQQDMLFASLTLEQGIKLNLHLWKMGIFYFILTAWNRVRFVPWESPIILDTLNTFHCLKNKQCLDNNVVCIFIFANWLEQRCKFLSFFLEQVQSLKDSVTLPHS